MERKMTEMAVKWYKNKVIELQDELTETTTKYGKEVEHNIKLQAKIEQLKTENKKQADFMALAKEEMDALKVVNERLKAEQKRKTCMCMDCGKVIKVTEQSKHLKECPKQALKGKQ